MDDDSQSIKFINFNVMRPLDIKTNDKFFVNNNKNKYIKIRNPGIDLVRILAMIGIIISHLLNHGQAFRKYHMHDKLNLFNFFFFWHINGYCLISGMVGYKRHKYSNLLYLWINVIFYSVSITLFYKLKEKNNYELYYEFFPVIFGKYWYFSIYFGTYLFLPLINKGIEYLTKSELKRLIISIYFIYIIWRDYNVPNTDIFKTHDGFSVLWFIILYITGAYIGKNKVDNNGIQNIIFCLICLFFFLSSSLLYYYLPRYNLSKINIYFIKNIIITTKKFFNFRYDSLPKIIQAISISLLLIHIKYNKYLAKVISFFGSLTFGVYLIHDNYLIRKNIIRYLFIKESNNLTLFLIIKLIIIKALKIFIICAFIDYIRYLIFELFRIRKLCNFIEKIILKLLI